MEGLISQDRGLCIANARKAAAYMDEYATVYRHQGKDAFQVSGDPRPLVADQSTCIDSYIVWTTDPRMKDQAVIDGRMVA